jgi:hypothetical protein
VPGDPFALEPGARLARAPAHGWQVVALAYDPSTPGGPAGRGSLVRNLGIRPGCRPPRVVCPAAG